MSSPEIPQISSPVWSARTKRLIGLICLGLAGLLLLQVSSALPMLIVALIIAYLLYPLTNWFESPFGRFRLPRGLAILFALIFMLLLLLLVILIVVPLLTGQIAQFANNIPVVLETVQTQLETWLSQPLTFNNQPILIEGQPIIPLEQIRAAVGSDDILQSVNIDFQALLGSLGTSVTSLSRPAFSFLGTAFNAIINSVFFLTLLVYLLKDGRMFAERLVQITPSTYQNDTRRLLYELGEVWNAYLRGQLLLSTFIGVVVTIAGVILGVPNAPVLGLISGVLEFIPTIGPTLALIPAVLLALFSQSATLPFLSGAGFALTVGIVWTVIQQIQAILVTPRVMGDSLDLHPFVVLLAVLAGASIGGALGVILAAPMMATLRLGAQYIYGKMTDTDPFPPNARRVNTLHPPNWLLRFRPRTKPVEAKS